MKNLFILCLFMGSYCFSFSQTISIVNHETDEPIAQASLESKEPLAFTTTNANGQADVSAFKGAKEITIRTLGYRTLIISYDELERSFFKVKMSPTSFKIEEVVISATRWKQVSSDIPVKIVAITPKEVALQNPQTAADLLGISGNVFVQKSQQGGGSPMIRGFATNRLLYSIDGIRMNTAIFRGGNIQNVISLDPFAIENTEVLFGPGSMIYGSDAIGGVMSFQTLTPQFSVDSNPIIQGKAFSRYASANDEMTAHFDINVGWKKWSMLSSISSNRFGDLRMGSHGPEEYLRPFYVQRIDSVDAVTSNDDPLVQKPSAYSQINMMQKVRFKPNEQWDLQYGFHYSETSDYARYDRHIRYKNSLPRYGVWNYGPQKWMMNNLNVTHTQRNKVYEQMTIRLAQQSFEESRISRDFNKDDLEDRIEEVDAYSINIDFTKRLKARHQLFYGIETVWNDVNSKGINEDISTGIESKGTSRYPQSTWASYGIYLSDQYTLSEKFLLQGGIRYNQYKLDAEFDTSFYPFPFTTAQLDDGALTGSIGFVYRPNDNWVISSNAATAFRSPNVDDVGKVFDSEPGAVVVPNPNLKAEYAYNIDFGIAHVFNETVEMDVTAYYTLLQDALVRRDFKLNGQDSINYDGTLSQVQAIQNAAEANVYGIQAGIEIKLIAGFEFSSDFNYQIGEEELDDGTTSPSRHAAPWFGVSRLTYKTSKLNLQLSVNYCGEKSFKNLPESEKSKNYIYAIDKNGDPYSPAWYTLDFKAIHQFAKQFTISAGLENITDQRYRPYSSGIVAPGRNFILGLKYGF